MTSLAPRARGRVRLPRTLPLVDPISRVEAGFHRTRGFYVRVSVLGMLVVVAFAVLGLRLWSLQVLQGPRLTARAQHQTFRVVDLPAPRGAIVDVRGRLLAGTDGRLALTADVDALGSADGAGRWEPTRHGRAVLTRLARLTGVRVPTLVGRIRTSLVRSPFAPAVVVPQLPRRLSQYLDERGRRYPGLHVVTLPERSYPQGALGSEFLGLLGEIGPGQLREGRYRGARPGQLVGQSGIEATYDRVLNGGLARARVRVDSTGRAVGPLRPTRTAAAPAGLRLTIDARLQRAAERAIRNGIALARANGHDDATAGAAVVMDARTGALHALASYPNFNQVAAARNRGYLAALLDGRNGAVPLLNRASQGLYPTGSTFKPIVAEAALSAGLITPYSVLPCTGSLTVGDVVFRNVDPSVNASLDLGAALSTSCDTWFYRLGTQFYWRQSHYGALDMQRWATRLGFGHPTGLDLPGEAGGIVPTPAWLRRTFREPWQRVWYAGYSVNLSIGQGYLAATPLQLAVAYAALANGGRVVRPHVADAVLDGAGNVRTKLAFPPRARVRLVGVQAIRDGLYAAANHPSGTSSAVFRGFPVPVAGKTGTAEAPPGSDHSWYASWAPAGDPRVVVVVLIEHGGFGSEAAAPAARQIYEAFFRLRPGREGADDPTPRA